MCFEVVAVLVSLGTRIQAQIILNLDYFPDYLAVSYGYELIDLYLLILNAGNPATYQRRITSSQR